MIVFGGENVSDLNDLCVFDINTLEWFLKDILRHIYEF